MFSYLIMIMSLSITICVSILSFNKVNHPLCNSLCIPFPLLFFTQVNDRICSDTMISEILHGIRGDSIIDFCHHYFDVEFLKLWNFILFVITHRKQPPLCASPNTSTRNNSPPRFVASSVHNYASDLCFGRPVLGVGLPATVVHQ